MLQKWKNRHCRGWVNRKFEGFPCRGRVPYSGVILRYSGPQDNADCAFVFGLFEGSRAIAFRDDGLGEGEKVG